MRASQTLRHPMLRRRFLASLGLPFARMGARLTSSPAGSDGAMVLGRTPHSGSAIGASSTWQKARPGKRTSCVHHSLSITFMQADGRQVS